jgi:hypothetical protein
MRIFESPEDILQMRAFRASALRSLTSRRRNANPNIAFRQNRMLTVVQGAIT